MELLKLWTEVVFVIRLTFILLLFLEEFKFIDVFATIDPLIFVLFLRLDLFVLEVELLKLTYYTVVQSGP